jgi:pantoate--beta-alanine ligase
MQEHSDRMRRLGKRIVLVPTMGFLHEGHLSLIREGRDLGDDLVVSIFVNPTQFGPGEDFESYPRNLDRDIGLIKKEKADCIFFPDQKELYSTGFQTYVRLEKLPSHLCGISRPTFFKGVATIVLKLFNIVKPHIAVFGQKDYQQLIIIRRMVKDLNLDIEIIGGQTVRESDGLAMSSRNSYLTPEQRPAALSLFKALNKAKELLADGINDASKIIEASSELIKSHGNTAIDYIAICDPETLEDMKIIDRPALMALAVNVGKARLIDNILLNPN